MAARLIDLSRLVSRLGRGPMTGIDRVEFAYLSRFLADDAPLFALVRSALGWLLLDQRGCAELARLAQGGADPGPADLLSRLAYRTDPTRARAESAARRLAMARAGRPGLARLLRRLPAQTAYFNLGHTNLTDRGLAALRAAGMSVTVMIHDTIPLDHPGFARPGTVDAFRRKLAATSAHASRVLHLTQATRLGTEAQLARLGRVPPGLTAPLGIDLSAPDFAALPPGLDLAMPYFVTLGTIEPRKNHALLLKIWDRLPAPRPRLFIVGARGWAAPDLLARLDSLDAADPVQVLHGLSDGAVSALLSGARALLAPSLAEGFGLPPVEAASLGTPVIATDLAVTRELLGNKAVYLSAADIYSWTETIVRQAAAPDRHADKADRLIAPSWDDHFKTVLSLA